MNRICRNFRKISLTEVSHGNQAHNTQNALHNHAAVTDGLDVAFPADLLGGGARGYQGVEAGAGAAGHQNKERGDHVSGLAVSDGNVVTGEGRELQIRSIAADAQNASQYHGIKQEGTQIVPGLQKPLYRNNRSQHHIDAQNSHPAPESGAFGSFRIHAPFDEQGYQINGNHAGEPDRQE